MALNIFLTHPLQCDYINACNITTNCFCWETCKPWWSRNERKKGLEGDRLDWDLSDLMYTSDS